MTLITADTLGALYILCFDRPIGNAENSRALAGHYLGFALDVPARIALHAAGHGSALTQAVVKAGIGWQVFYRPGTPGLERWLKAHYKNTPGLCPRCCTKQHRRPRYGFQPLEQLALPLITVDDGFEFPFQPAGRPDGMEIAIIRSSRISRAELVPTAGLAAVDECL